MAGDGCAWRENLPEFPNFREVGSTLVLTVLLEHAAGKALL
jgi:hypothetical protein